MPPSDSPDPKPPLNEQIADLALKLIMTGGLAGGGVGAFWQLFKNSDIPRAIATAGIGLGLSYAAKMLMPVHKGNQRRLEQAGQAIDKGIDNVLELVTAPIIRNARGFENKYLLCQAAECQTLRSEGVPQQDKIFIPLLKEVFVPLALDSSALHPGFRNLADVSVTDGQLTERTLTIWDFLAKSKSTPTFRQLAILAWGGYGKTTLLKHIAFRYGIKQVPKGAPTLIPILLVLRQYREILAQETPPDLSDLITQYHIPNLPESDVLQPNEDWAKTLLRDGRALVMFDGFDEVGTQQRPRVAAWITEQIRRYGRSVFLVTSRPKAYKNQDAAKQLKLNTPMWVREFNESQRREFITRWYQCQERYANAGRDTPDVKKVAAQSAENLLTQIESQSALKSLARNPLLLNMIATFHRRVPGAELPKRKVELYGEICRLQLKDRPRARGVGGVMTQCEAQGILQQVAFAMMQRHWERIPRSTLLGALTKILERQNESFAAKDFLDDVVQVSELLVQQEDEYEFAHLSFQEYLAAAHVAQTKREQLLYQHLKDDWWKSMILLYAGLVSPTQLIREAVNQGATDLAYQCLQETTKQVDATLAAGLEAVKQTVIDARYGDLETYLKNGEWKKADDETYRLMITEVGKEVGQGFTRDELLNFPCDELKAIDNLWVTHSEGKYGFSVQKEIYLNCGGVADGKYYEEAFEKFGDRVAWRNNNSWVVDMKWDGSGPMGHLPLWAYGCGGGVLFSRIETSRLGASRVWGFSSLASRLVDCNR